MNQYEVMYVVDAALEDSARNELINRFNELVVKNGGEVERVDEWGKRRLAYAINYKTEGYYVLMYIKAPAELPRELERNLKISDQVLRYLVIRYEGELPAKREMNRPVRENAEAPAAASVAPVAPVVAPRARRGRGRERRDRGRGSPRFRGGINRAADPVKEVASHEQSYFDREPDQGPRNAHHGLRRYHVPVHHRGQPPLCEPAGRA